MRSGSSIPALLPMPFTALAGDMAPESQFVPPPYRVLRFDEDYFCLRTPSNRTDWLDPIKYIPLRTGEPTWYLNVNYVSTTLTFLV